EEGNKEMSDLRVSKEENISKRGVVEEIQAEIAAMMSDFERCKTDHEYLFDGLYSQIAEKDSAINRLEEVDSSNRNILTLLQSDIEEKASRICCLEEQDDANKETIKDLIAQLEEGKGIINGLQTSSASAV